ncbi:MAG: nitrogenase component 1 [Desulfococcaceae bacterium]
MKIAIYGKGGIGKSTVAANLSAALAESGQRVLQIGCDPKHDSTRLLLDGRAVTTALDYMREVTPMNHRLDDLLHIGYAGVTCAEAGGPEPGVGCAGRGILSTFALFDRLGLAPEDFDVIVYDVLGDVVCGGFAVPLRKGFADVVYIVTSEEFMAIYAANNILRGVRNFDGQGPRLAGIILNSRGPDEDPASVHRFAEAAELPIVCRISRSDRFRKAEEQNRTVIQAFPDSVESGMFRNLAGQITGSGRLYPAKPLADFDLERIIYRKRGPTPTHERPVQGGSPVLKPEKKSEGQGESTIAPAMPPAVPHRLSKSMLFREPLHGCAFTGAISTTTQIRGAVTVAHGPRSCAHIAHRTVLSSGIRAARRRRQVLPRQLAPSVISSDMNEGVVIYGGGEALQDTLFKALSQAPSTVFVVTACPAGVIGDDAEAAVQAARAAYPEIPVIAITSDGNIQGDYMQGVINACLEGAAALIDPSVKPEGDRVNILAEKNIANNAESNFRIIADLLGALEIEVNCRFVRDTPAAALRGFRKARLNLLAYEDHFGRVLRTYFTEHHQAAFAARPFPVGFAETERWLAEIAAAFGRTDTARRVADERRSAYEISVAEYRSHLAGKRLMIVSYIHDVDWILETAFDLGMAVEKVGILNYSQDHIFRTRFKGRFDLETGYTPRRRDADLTRIRPDLLLCNYVPGQMPVSVHADGIPFCPDVGFLGGIAYARRWAALLKAPIREGWRNDRV